MLSHAQAWIENVSSALMCLVSVLDTLYGADSISGGSRCSVAASASPESAQLSSSIFQIL